ncbi:MAG: peptidylprolyl isomerase [Phycisphaerae bacterium]|nr:peptidylprolyl isomerase [Phycisphaerae bacterium]
MRVLLTTVLAMAVMGLTGYAYAQDLVDDVPITESVIPTKPALPTLPDVVAKVGDREINAYEVERVLMVAPPGQMAPPSQITRMLIGRELVRNFLKVSKIEVTDDEIKAKKAEFEDIAKKTNLTVEQVMLMKRITEDDLRDQIAIDKLVKDRVEAKVDDFIAKNPNAFNGTSVKASHILLRCDPTDSTADQMAVKKRLEGILADIKAKKVTFADAAKANSDDGSASKGGDLGEFMFPDMVFPFAQAAFSTKVGELSGVVQSQYGFHIILVTGRNEGQEKIEGDRAKGLASRLLMGQLESEVFTQATNGVTVEIFVKDPEPMFMMPDGMP